jgi:hypothetical protein
VAMASKNQLSDIENAQSKFTCKIDFEIYDSNENKPLVFNCGHTICKKCYERLQRKFCPICRTEIKSVNTNYTLIELIENDKNKQTEDSSVEKNVTKKDKPFNLAPSKFNFEVNQATTSSLSNNQSTSFANEQVKYDRIIKNNKNLIEKLNKSNSTFFAVALEDNNANNFDELSFKKNQTIENLTKVIIKFSIFFFKNIELN